MPTGNAVRIIAHDQNFLLQYVRCQSLRNKWCQSLHSWQCPLLPRHSWQCLIWVWTKQTNLHRTNCLKFISHLFLYGFNFIFVQIPHQSIVWRNRTIAVWLIFIINLLNGYDISVIKVAAAIHVFHANFWSDFEFQWLLLAEGSISMVSITGTTSKFLSQDEHPAFACAWERYVFMGVSFISEIGLK